MTDIEGIVAKEQSAKACSHKRIDNKYQIIYLHREAYPASVMCRVFVISRSGYYSFVRRLGRAGADAELGRGIQAQQRRCRQIYGYRRMWLELEKEWIHRNHKAVLRVMEKFNLLSEIRKPRKWVQMEQQIHKYKNLLNRNFQAGRPNSKWVADISYIHTRDCLKT